MNQQTLRFRAIDPDTGATSEPFDLSSDPTWADARLVGYSPHDWIGHERTVFSQSTGLTDITGAEVFDGDVLATMGSDRLAGEILLYRVYFADGAHWIGWFEQPKKKKFDGRLGEFRMRLSQNAAKALMIVGNKYEPLEMLRTRAQEALANG